MNNLTGVYEIWISKYFYHGSSINCEERCSSHLKELKAGKHGNSKMQNAFNKHGTFEWRQLVQCDNRKVAYQYEQDYIDGSFGLPEYLNISPISTHSGCTWADTIKGKKRSEETRAKISKANSGKKNAYLSELNKSRAGTVSQTGKKAKYYYFNSTHQRFLVRRNGKSKWCNTEDEATYWADQFGKGE